MLILNVDVEKRARFPWLQAASAQALDACRREVCGRFHRRGARLSASFRLARLSRWRARSTASSISRRSPSIASRRWKTSSRSAMWVRCKVLEVSPEAKRISLSRKEALLEEDPALAEQLAAEKAERRPPVCGAPGTAPAAARFAAEPAGPAVAAARRAPRACAAFREQRSFLFERQRRPPPSQQRGMATMNCRRCRKPRPLWRPLFEGLKVDE